MPQDFFNLAYGPPSTLTKNTTKVEEVVVVWPRQYHAISRAFVEVWVALRQCTDLVLSLELESRVAGPQPAELENRVAGPQPAELESRVAGPQPAELKLQSCKFMCP